MVRFLKPLEIIERGIIWLSPLIILGVFLNVVRGMQSGNDWVPFVQSVLICLIIIIAFLKKYIPDRARYTSYIASILLIGSIGLVKWGLAGQDYSLFLLALLIASSLQLKNWVGVMIIAIGVSIVVAVGNITGFISTTIDYEIYSRSTLPWIISILVFSITASCILIWQHAFKQLKEYDKVLKASERQFRNIFNQSILGIYQITPDGKIIMANPALISMMGYDTLEELQKTNLEEKGYVEKSTRQRIKELVEKEGKVIGFESEWTKQDGSIIHIRENSVGVFGDDGQLLYYEGTIEDITYRKEMDGHLRLFKAALTESSDAINMATPDGLHYYHNKSFDELFGDIKEDNENILRLYADYNVARDVLSTIKNGSLWSGEVLMYGVNGDILNILLRAYAIKGQDDKVLGLVGLHTDITARKRAEKALLENEKKYSTVVENSKDAILIHQNGIIVYANPALLENTGFSNDQVVGKKMLKFIHPESHDLIVKRVKARYEAALDNDIVVIRILSKSGHYIHFEVNTAIIDYMDQPAIVVFLKNIEKRIKADEQLRQYKRAVEGSQDLVVAIDRDYRVIFTNKAYLMLHQLVNENIEGHLFTEIVDGDYFEQKVKPSLDKCWNDEIVNVELSYNYFGIGVKYLDTRFYPLKNEKNSIVGVIGIAHDITDRIVANDQLKKSLQEKEVMLKEIHHRVKNNLQIMSSLIYLQSKHKGDVAFKESANELTLRIKSMAYIHELLYRSKDMASIFMPLYIDTLVQSIKMNYSFDSIEINKDIDEIYLDVDHSVPIGLVFSELFSNVIKHAFPKGKGGAIAISLKKNNGEIDFKFSDNGVGFPESFSIDEPSSLGMKLVSILTQQLGGSIKIDRSNGAAIQLKFNNNKT